MKNYRNTGEGNRRGQLEQRDVVHEAPRVVAGVHHLGRGVHRHSAILGNRTIERTESHNETRSSAKKINYSSGHIYAFIFPDKALKKRKDLI